MVLNTEWSQVEEIELENDGLGLGFGIIGGRSTGVVVKTLIPGSVSERDGRLQTGDHILQIGEVSLRGMGSEQAAMVLRQAGAQVRLVVARPVEPTAPTQHILQCNAPILPTRILTEPEVLAQQLEIFNRGGHDSSQVLYQTVDDLLQDLEEQDPDFAAQRKASLLEKRSSSTERKASITSERKMSQSEVVMKISPMKAPIPIKEECDLPETEIIDVDLVKDEQGLGVTIAGYVCEKEVLSGIFIKSIAKGSVADLCQRINKNDQIIEVDGISLQGKSNHQAVEVLRGTGSHVHMRLIRYLRGPKYEQLQQAIATGELSPPSTKAQLQLLSTKDPSPSPPKLNGSAVSLSSTYEDDIKRKWKQNLGLDCTIVVAEVNKFRHGGGLGISLEGTVDVEDGKEVRPHHYIRTILPDGPVGRCGVLKTGDELLEVNGIKLHGLFHLQVVTILKQLPVNVCLVCARGLKPIPSPSLTQHRIEIREKRRPIDGMVKAKSDGYLYMGGTLLSPGVIKTPFFKVKSRSLEPLSSLAKWSSDPQIIELVKEDRGLGFSILDYQDPMNVGETVIVIRSLVPGGVAHLDGRLRPGDRLLSVNGTRLEKSTLDIAVKALKGAPRGIVKIVIAKPLPVPDMPIKAVAPQRRPSRRRPWRASSRAKSLSSSSIIHSYQFIPIPSSYHSSWEEDLGSSYISLRDELSRNVTPSSLKSGDSRCSTPLSSSSAGKLGYDLIPSFPASLEQTIRIKKGHDNMGITLEMMDKAINGLVVRGISKRSAVFKDSRLQVGDYILNLNNENMRNITRSQGRAILRRTDLVSTDILVTYVPALEANLHRQNAVTALRLGRETPSPTVLSRHQSPRVFPELYRSPYFPATPTDFPTKLEDSKSLEGLGSSPFSITDDHLSTFPTPSSVSTDFSFPHIDQYSGRESPEDTMEFELDASYPSFEERRALFQNLDNSTVPSSSTMATSFLEPSIPSGVSSPTLTPSPALLPCPLSITPPDHTDPLLDFDSLPPPPIEFVPPCDKDPYWEQRRTSSENLPAERTLASPTDIPTDTSEATRDQISESFSGSKYIPRQSLSIPSESPKRTFSSSSSISEIQWGPERIVRVFRQPGASLGLTIVYGRMDRDDPEKCVSGIFIKHVVPDSPAGKSDGLFPGDKILEVDGIDVRNSTHDKAVDIIKKGRNPVTFIVQRLLDMYIESDNSSGKNSPIPSPLEPPVQAAQEPYGTIQRSLIKQQLSPDDQWQLPRIPSPGVIQTGIPPRKPSLDVGIIPPPPGFAELSPESDTDEEFDRKVWGKVFTKKGMEIDRGSAGHMKLSARDKVESEEEDLFGYTKKKIQNKYSELKGEILEVELQRGSSGLGLSLAGNRDRSKMSVFVCGIHPLGNAARDGRIQIADEILEVNGLVLYGRCHLNASAIIKGLTSNLIKLIIIRRERSVEDMAVKPLSQFPISLSCYDERYSKFAGLRSVTATKNPQGLGIMIIEGKHADTGQGIYISDIQKGGPAEQAGLHVGDMILSVNQVDLQGSDYETAAEVLTTAEGSLSILVANPNQPGEVERRLAENSLKKISEKKKMEPPQPISDPHSCPVIAGREITLMISKELLPLGMKIVGGFDTPLGAVIIHDIFPEGAAAKDTRLKRGDQVLEVNGVNLREASHATAESALYHTPSQVQITVFRESGHCEVYDILEIELYKKPGRSLGLCLEGRQSGAGIFVSETIKGGLVENDGRIMQGDQILEINGIDLRTASHQYASCILKLCGGRIHLKIGRLKPVSRYLS